MSNASSIGKERLAFRQRDVIGLAGHRVEALLAPVLPGLLDVLA